MGKPKYIESPEKMWELFEAYIKDVKSKPFVVTDWVGGMAKEVQRFKEKPLTMEGFENYCFKLGVIGEMSHYFSNKDGRYANYVAICSRIRQVIRQDQIEGGMAGMYNPSVTQRLNGLVEKAQTDNTITVKIDGSDNISA